VLLWIHLSFRRILFFVGLQVCRPRGEHRKKKEERKIESFGKISSVRGPYANKLVPYSFKVGPESRSSPLPDRKEGRNPKPFPSFPSERGYSPYPGFYSGNLRQCDPLPPPYKGRGGRESNVLRFPPLASGVGHSVLWTNLKGVGARF
jgi:hypothetical protein